VAGWYQWQGGVLVLRVHVQPRAGQDQVVGIQNERLKIRITAPPVDGAANTHLIHFMAREFRVPKSRVEILSGETGREKRLAIHAPRTRPKWFEHLG